MFSLLRRQYGSGLDLTNPSNEMKSFKLLTTLWFPNRDFVVGDSIYSRAYRALIGFSRSLGAYHTVRTAHIGLFPKQWGEDGYDAVCMTRCGNSRSG